MEYAPSTWERSLNWSPDGKSVLGGTFDGTVLVWDAASGHLKGRIGDECARPGNACFNDVGANRDGMVATVSDDGYVRRGRLTSTEAVWLDRVAPNSGRVLMNAVNLDDSSGRIVAGAHDHSLHIFKTSGGVVSPVARLSLGEGPINCVRVATSSGFEGDSFAACYSGAIVRVGRNHAVTNRFVVHNGAVKALRIHPLEPVGVSCSADGLLVSWTLAGEIIRTFAGHTAIADDVDIDPSGRMIASVGRDFVLKVHDLASGLLLHAIRLGRRSPKSVCFLTESTVVVGAYWGTLIRVELARQSISRRRIAGNGISGLCRCGNFLAAASYDGSVYLVRPSDLEVLNALTAMVQRPPAGRDEQ